MKATIKPVGTGLNKDLLPSELAPGQWSDGLNMRMSKEFAQKRGGIYAAYNTPSVTPYGLMTYGIPTDRYLIKMGANRVYADNVATDLDITPYQEATFVPAADVPAIEYPAGTVGFSFTQPIGVNVGDTIIVYGFVPNEWNGTWTVTWVNTYGTDIKFNITTPSGGSGDPVVMGGVAIPASQTAFSATDGGKWTGGVLNGILVVNNSVDPPQFWNGTATTKLQRLIGWSAGDTAVSVRTFKDFIFALGPTLSGQYYPHNIMWSSSAEPGSLPTSWTASNLNDAGDSPEAAATPGKIVDALPMGEVLVVYKEDARYAVQYIGGNDVFRVMRLPGTDGVFTQNCIVDTPKGHVFATADDIKIHQGGEAQSIADGRVRRYIFDNIEPDFKERMFLVSNPRRSEVWVCFPTIGNSACNRACVWNWEDNTWSIFSLPNVTCAATGLLNQSVSFSTTWAASTDTWTTVTGVWGAGDRSTTEQSLILGTASAIGVADAGVTDFGSSISAYLEKTGISLDAPDVMKVLNRSRPQMKAPTGTVVSVYHGSHKNANDSATYAGATSYTVGTSTEANSFSNAGRYLAVKFDFSANASDDKNNPTIRSYDIEFEQGGKW